jgi:hypothetical protein
MPAANIELLTIRREIEKALECLDGDGAADGQQRRETLVRYLRRALLLLTGFTVNQIVG